MALNPQALGKTTPELLYSYRWQDAVLYALGIGATREELDFLYEGRGPKVMPTFAVVPAFAAAEALFAGIGGNLEGVVHGSQRISLHQPFAPAGTVKTIGKVSGLYDLKRMAQAIITTETRNESGTLLAETEWSILYRLDGGFGGSPPPRRGQVRPPERAPDWQFEQAISPEQALLYRLSGDLNPLHADPALGEKVGFGGPILHGLCTYGIVGRAVLHHACGDDPTKLTSLQGQFRNPVYPGDTLIVEGWHEDGKVILRAYTTQKPTDYVFGNAFAQYTK